MSSATSDNERLDVSEQIARIERAITENQKLAAEQRKLDAENLKFAAEQRKLDTENLKFVAEQRKLMAEAVKLERDTRLAPWLAGGAVAGGIVTVATLLLRALGVLS